MQLVRAVAAMLLMVVVLGCGGGREAGQTVTPPPPDAKVTLEEVAATGTLPKPEEKLRQEIESLGESDPAKAEELLADYNQLISMSDSTAIKAKAAEMAAKLSNGS